MSKVLRRVLKVYPVPGQPQGLGALQWGSTWFPRTEAHASKFLSFPFLLFSSSFGQVGLHGFCLGGIILIIVYMYFDHFDVFSHTRYSYL